MLYCVLNCGTSRPYMSNSTPCKGDWHHQVYVPTRPRCSTHIRSSFWDLQLSYGSRSQARVSLCPTLYSWCLGGQLRPHKQQIQFSEFTQSNLLPTCKAVPKRTTTCTALCFTQYKRVCNSTRMMQEVQMLWPDMPLYWAIKVLLVARQDSHGIQL